MSANVAAPIDNTADELEELFTVIIHCENTAETHPMACKHRIAIRTPMDFAVPATTAPTVQIVIDTRYTFCE